jgi:ubiquinone/menaquinone biosynthesis C-methylase UbiE
MSEEQPPGRIRRMEDGERSARQYDAMAAEYAADNASSPYNAFYERPATMALLGKVAGRRVLEVGCGSGILTNWLVDQGATVTAMDVSPAMLDLARRSIGDRADLVVADLAAPLPFETSAFDIAVASLVLHYVRDWTASLRELHRVLNPEGLVVFSTHHPTMDWVLNSLDDYFTVKQWTDTWPKGGRAFEVTFWRRPLTAMCEAIADAGFVIERLVEPEPLAELAERDADAYETIRTKPRFLFFRLRPT